MMVLGCLGPGKPVVLQGTEGFGRRRCLSRGRKYGRLGAQLVRCSMHIMLQAEGLVIPGAGQVAA